MSLEPNRNDAAVLKLSLSTLSRCKIAATCEERGNYDEAREAIGDRWSRVGERPNIDGLDLPARAELLLRAGVLTGWLGSARRVEGAQKLAQDLISEAQSIFEQAADINKVAEAQTALAVCYWREGGFDNARVVLEMAYAYSEITSKVRLNVLLNRAIIEWSDHKYREALRFYEMASLLLDEVNNTLMRGRYHRGMASALNSLGESDRAFEHSTAACIHFEKAEHWRFYARTQVGLALLYLSKEKLEEAHERLDKAVKCFERTTTKDIVALSMAEEVRARIFLTQDRGFEAFKASKRSVDLVKDSDEHAILVENLTTHATVLNRINQPAEAFAAFKHAYNIAVVSVSEERAAQVAVAMIKEIKEFPKPEFSLKGQTLEQAVHSFERSIIKEALHVSGDSVTKAAKLLGLESYQALQSMLKHRHRDLRDPRPAPPLSITRQSFKIVSSDSKAADVHIISRSGKVSIKLPPELKTRKDKVAIRIHDESLKERNVKEGDLLIVVHEEAVDGDPVVILSGKDYHFGYVKTNEKQYLLTPANSCYKPLSLFKNRARIVGKILGYCSMENADPSKAVEVRPLE